MSVLVILKILRKNCKTRREKFYSFLAGKKIRDKKHEHVPKVWNKFETKTMKDDYSLYLKWDCHRSKELFFFFCFNEISLKMVKNDFSIILKALYVPKIFKFLS